MLEDWRKISEFKADSDWVWASPFVAGEMPYYLNAVQRDYIIPAGKRAAWENPLAGTLFATPTALGWTRTATARDPAGPDAARQYRHDDEVRKLDGGRDAGGQQRSS